MRMVAIAILVVLIFSLSVESQAPQLPPMSEIHKGVNFIPWSKPFASRESDKTVSQLIRPMGVSWVAVNVRCVQTTVRSPLFQCPQHSQRASDSDIAHVVRMSHSLGMRVMLRVMVPVQTPGQWSGQIDFENNDAAWGMWFSSYKEFMVALAKLARQLDVDYFTVGAELDGTTRRVAEWRSLVNAVREVYPGPLVYDANHGEEENVTWSMQLVLMRITR